MRALLAPFSFLLLSVLFSGCMVYVEDTDPPEFHNSSPEVLSDGTWWLCDFDWVEGESYFEFQAVVGDPDGWDDVVEVSVTLFEAPSGIALDSFSLNPEDEDIWGGFVWESDSTLFCGEALDVAIEVTDWHGAWDRLWILY